MPARQCSQTDKALDLVRRGITPYSAAKQCGIALSTIYRSCARNGVTYANMRPKQAV